MSDLPQDSSERPFIELEPAVSSSARAAPPSLPEGVTPEMLDARRTVPAKPPHACPTCDYNLTGLTSRRCPECGETFTLAEARMAAFALSEPMKRFVRHSRWNQFKFWLGVLLLAGSFVAINWFSVSTPLVGPSFLMLTSQGALMVALIFLVVVTFSIFRAYYELPWSNTILLAGMIVAIVASLMI